jgi:adenylate cyclase
VRIRYYFQNQEFNVPLEGAEVKLGRGTDADLVLPDFSVSRLHAALRSNGREWRVVDLGSTNGIELNGVPVADAPIKGGDCIKVGIFELQVEAPPEASPRSAIANATIVRPFNQFETELGMLEPITKVSDGRERNFFSYLTRLARELIDANTVESVLTKVMDIAFEAFPVDRGFILLGHDAETAVCELSRIKDETQIRPDSDELPVSRTILRTVLEEQVALLTLDALDDQRLASGHSIRIHGIRSAMCAPLWSDDRLIGFIQVDSLIQAGSFTEEDLNFLIALSNYGAVGVERVRDRAVRGRLERYHSPAILEQVIAAGGDADGTEIRRAEVTVLFADLVGFTAFSETAEPEQVAELLNGYCSRAVEAIFQEGGTLDKFIGDCVMAFFGAPVVQHDHAARGVRAGVAIQDAVDDWNAERASLGEAPVRCRVALYSGPVVVGDVGSHTRVDYTVLGNTVNVAARLESNVAQPGDVVAGDSTILGLTGTPDPTLGGRITLEPLGNFALKGLQKEIEAFRIVRGRRPL